MVGGRKVEHLKSNVEALSVQLSTQEVAEIEQGYDFDLGFPHNFINMAGFAAQGPQHVSLLGNMGHFDYVEPQAAIKPHQVESTTT